MKRYFSLVLLALVSIAEVNSSAIERRANTTTTTSKYPCADRSITQPNYNGCYPQIYKGDITHMQPWGAYLDLGGPKKYPPDILPRIPTACGEPGYGICNTIGSDFRSDQTRGKWYFQVTASPGCLAAVYLPPSSDVPLPSKTDCWLEVIRPMQDAWLAAIGSGFNRVSVNVKEYPKVPNGDTKLTETSRVGAKTFDVDFTGSAVNSSLPSFFMEAFDWSYPDGGVGSG